MRAVEHTCSLRPSPRPLWLLASSSDDAGARARSDSEPPYSAARRLRILVVEDEVLIALDMRAMLEASGHVVIGIAGSADHAIATAARERPDIALMDIALIGPRDGIDAAIELREQLNIPSLFITAHPDSSLRERAQTAKPLGFMAKPLDEDVLRRILAAL